MANPYFGKDDGLMNRLTEALFNSMNQNQQAKFLGKRAVDDVVPINIGAALGENGAGLRDLGQAAMGAASAHPFKTAGLVGLGAGNLGGLTDNDKFGGQLGGLALGGLGSYMMGTNPYTAALLTLGGGELGSLYDKLRARKEMEQPQPFYGR